LAGTQQKQEEVEEKANADKIENKTKAFLKDAQDMKREIDDHNSNFITAQKQMAQVNTGTYLLLFLFIGNPRRKYVVCMLLRPYSPCMRQI